MKGEINKIDISNNKKKKVINTKTMEIFNSLKLIKTNNVWEAKDFVKIAAFLHLEQMCLPEVSLMLY